MRSLVPILIAAALLSGCATISAPDAKIARVPITTEAADGLHFVGPDLRIVDGRLVLNGSVRRTSRFRPFGDQHVDVEFRDSRSTCLALRSSPLRFQRKRFGPPWPAHFSMAVEQWPEGTAMLLIRTHAGASHL
jgi:hypothetical protein